MPAKPPPPTASKLPFQPADGSQTSTLIAGAMVSCTRQNAGSVTGRGALAAPGGVGGVNGPDSTAAADVTVVSGSFIDARSSHFFPVSAEAGEGPNNSATAATAKRTGINRYLIRYSFRSGNTYSLSQHQYVFKKIIILS